MANLVVHNSGRLVRIMVRQDRIRIPVWILSLSFLTFAVANAFANLYASEQERQSMGETMRNPAMIAMVGQGYGLDNYTNGAMLAHQMLLFTALAVAIMSILIVTRHTRADEEDGRIEMIRSLPVGRLATLQATIVLSFGVNIVLALFAGFGLYALQIESMDLEGSLLYGASLGATGIIFSAITAFLAQLTENSRGTIGFSITVLLLSYLMRAIGDVSNEILSVLSPLGLILRTETYVNNYWWPIAAIIGVALVLITISFYLNVIRDLGAGFIPARPGRKNASKFLQNPFGLALRLQRTGLIAWAVGMLILGASYGAVFGDLEAFFTNNEMMEKMFAHGEGFSLMEQFLTTLMKVIAILCTVPPLLAILKLKGEEKRNFTEHLLSRAVSRSRLLGSYLTVSVISGFAMLSLASVGLGTAANSVMDDAIPFGVFYQSAIVYFPALLIMIGIAMLFIGFAPKRSGFTWLYLTFSFFVLYVGKLLQLPEWLGKLSPFGYVPELPVGDMDIINVSILTIVGVLLIVVGFIGYNKRDIYS
ncbi:ABC transporter permease [Sporosarcina thermotolerans]|uniref:ABC transporter permease n=1 Tax=Sporosarcina thermotolerans TaxID=633404 RepID=A0AAW9A797_9BACL|nr:ABC transporter permease [Sporosarcina thermotolerans]MDW0115506.1 ABC transporter permease [Sporosarcina thermotolerans]WHT47172.1 ABC transporter permease [Sporosarcina thermotolerans]